MQAKIITLASLVWTSIWGRRVQRSYEEVSSTSPTSMRRSNSHGIAKQDRSPQATVVDPLRKLAIFLVASAPVGAFMPATLRAGLVLDRLKMPSLSSVIPTQFRRLSNVGMEATDGTKARRWWRPGTWGNGRGPSKRKEKKAEAAPLKPQRVIKTSQWPPTVQGMGLAFQQLRAYSFKEYLRLKPLELIGRALDGDLAAIAGGPLFRLLEMYKQEAGPIYKLSFAGFQEFLVVSDPVIARHILRDNAESYDKGMLAEILKDIMGQGLIPANLEVWKKRRKVIKPGFHRNWLNAMLKLFASANGPLIDKLEQACDSGDMLSMETEFSSVTLDIIGKAVFNFDFGSVTNESPVVKAVYGALQEAERRSTSILPYWKLPRATKILPNMKKFAADMHTLNEVLDKLISEAFDTQTQADEEDLVNRDYDSMENPSLLRFLVDMRQEDASCSQLRDDLMTMLIAGHETSAAVLTWTMYELSQNPYLYAEVRAEIDAVLGSRDQLSLEDIQKMPLVRNCIAETLRMYPEPPLLIRRSLKEDSLPTGGARQETTIPKGTDVIISTWNLHRSPDFWENPDVYNPTRWNEPFSNPDHPYWSGYKPPSAGLYPTEVNADYAFMAFGGGSRRCVGDQFAVMESVVTLSLLLQRFDLSLGCEPEEVGMRTGATIHTENGLPMRITRRQGTAPYEEQASRHHEADHAATTHGATSHEAERIGFGASAEATSLKDAQKEKAFEP